MVQDKTGSRARLPELKSWPFQSWAGQITSLDQCPHLQYEDNPSIQNPWATEIKQDTECNSVEKYQALNTHSGKYKVLVTTLLHDGLHSLYYFYIL